MVRSFHIWVRSMFRPGRRGRSPALTVTPLERRDNPSFAVTFFDVGSGKFFARFIGNNDPESLTVSVATDGFLQHDLVQPDLASPFDFDSSTPGEQRLLSTDVLSISVFSNGGDDSVTLLGPQGATVEAGDGNDVIQAPNATLGCLLNGGLGDDLLVAGAGNDFLVGAGGNDTISGGAGNDHIEGRDGNDILRGEDGDDDIDDGAGLDDSNGGPGANTLLDADVSAVRLTNTLLRIDGITNRDHGFVSVVLFGTDGDTTVNAAGYTLGPIEVHAAGGSNSLT